MICIKLIFEQYVMQIMLPDTVKCPILGQGRCYARRLTLKSRRRSSLSGIGFCKRIEMLLPILLFFPLQVWIVKLFVKITNNCELEME